MFHLRIMLTAMRALRQNLLRTLLATLGVVIGVGAVVAAVSILEGSQRQMLGQTEALGADQLIVLNGSRDRSHRRVMTNSLLPEDADSISKENPELVVATSPQFVGGGQMKYFARNTYVSILGTTASYAKIHDYKAAEGRFITPQDVRGKSMVCVLGHTVAADLFGALPAVHERVKLNGKTFMVVGVMEERGAIGMIDADKQVIMPLTTAMRRMFGARHLTVLTVQCADAGSLPLCIERVQKTLRVAHRIRAGAEDDFSIITQEVMKRFVAGITKISAIVLYSIAGISTVVGAIGIMNIMLVSVTERTREIGVRMAVGARRFDILRQFLTEATVISVLGGALGILFGVAMANLIVTFSGDIFQVHTRLSLIVGALTMAAVVGIISGIYPAIRAARLDPVQALRYE